MNFPLSFFLGFICTAGLFVLCYILVIGVKTLLFAVKKFLPKKELPVPVEVEKPTPKKPKTVKSIEIDPAFVDKIYVKKSS